jgi:hypothetical protein
MSATACAIIRVVVTPLASVGIVFPSVFLFFFLLLVALVVLGVECVFFFLFFLSPSAGPGGHASWLALVVLGVPSAGSLSWLALVVLGVPSAVPVGNASWLALVVLGVPSAGSLSTREGSAHASPHLAHRYGCLFPKPYQYCKCESNQNNLVYLYSTDLVHISH